MDYNGEVESHANTVEKWSKSMQGAADPKRSKSLALLTIKQSAPLFLFHAHILFLLGYI